MIKLDPGFSSDPLSDAHSLSFDLLFSVEVKSEKQEMHRSASTPRVSDDYSKYHSSPPSSSSSSSAVLRALSLEADELPVLEPMSEVYKKEKSRIKLGETVVHIIPFVLLFCALVLWFFSNPGNPTLSLSPVCVCACGFFSGPGLYSLKFKLKSDATDIDRNAQIWTMCLES